MTGTIALVGGDEFRSGCEEMDTAILHEAGVQHPKVLIVPTAAVEGSPAKAAANGVSYFSGLGAQASSLMVLEAAHANDPELVSALDDVHMVYFSGGNPAYLLESIAGSLLLRKVTEVLERGAILAGSSAGAMVLGSWMRFRGWKTALGVVPGVATMPHHERSDPDSVAKELAESAPDGLAVLGIPGKSCCLKVPGGWKVLGVGAVTLYQGGSWRQFDPGETINLR